MTYVLSSKSKKSPKTSPGTISQVGTLVSYVAGTGVRLVHFGIPFAPGLVFPSNMHRLRILISGVEQSIVIHDHGCQKHADGSFKILIFQFYATLTFGVPQAFTLESNISNRNLANDLTFAPQTYNAPAGGNYKLATPEAIISFPPAYLCRCRIFDTFDLRYRNSGDAYTLPYDDNLFFDWDIFTRVGGIQPTEDGLNLDPYVQYKQWNGSTTNPPFTQYDLGFHHFRFWQMTGDTNHLQQALAFAAWYYTVEAAVPNNIAVWMLSPMMMAMQYFFTGDLNCRAALIALSNHHFAVANVPGGGIDDYDDEPRPIAFRILCGMACAFIGDTSVNWKARVDSYFAGWNASAGWNSPYNGYTVYWHRRMYNDGNCNLAANAAVTHNFFLSLCINCSLTYEAAFNSPLPASIQTRISQLLEFLRLSEYRPTGNSSVTTTPDFRYNNYRPAGACSAVDGPGNDNYNLNGLYAGSFAWAGKVYNNAAWKAMGENMLQTLQRRTHRGPGASGNGPYLYSARTQQESFRWFAEAFAARA